MRIGMVKVRGWRRIRRAEFVLGGLVGVIEAGDEFMFRAPGVETEPHIELFRENRVRSGRAPEIGG